MNTLSHAVENGRRAVQEQCDRPGIDAEVVHSTVAGTYRVVRRARPGTTVTVVVPTRIDDVASDRSVEARGRTHLRAIRGSSAVAGRRRRPLVVCRPEAPRCPS